MYGQRRTASICSAGISCATPQARTSEQAAAPVARKEPHVTQINGDTLRGDYFWLRNKGTPEVESYLNAEAAYADAMMKSTEELRKRLYGEMLSRIQEDDSSAPVR